eukprot:jgi/Bigna1/84933/estExt_fgenesh1_pg.C_10409
MESKGLAVENSGVIKENETSEPTVQDQSVATSWWGIVSQVSDSVSKHAAVVSSSVSKHAAVVVEQGTAALQSAQEDLKEFASTLSNETVEIKEEMQDQLEKVTEKLKISPDKNPDSNDIKEKDSNSIGGLGALSDNIEKMGGFLSQLLPNSNKQPTSKKQKDAMLRKVPLSQTPGEAKLMLMRSTRTSYTENPTDTKFKEYLNAFGSKHENELKEEVLDTLNNEEDVRGFYTSLVPDTVTDQEFWARYFFRVKMLQKEEERRKFLLARLKKDDKSPKRELERDSAKIVRTPKTQQEQAQVPSPNLQSSEKDITKHNAAVKETTVTSDQNSLPREEIAQEGSTEKSKAHCEGVEIAESSDPVEDGNEAKSSPESGGQKSETSQNSSWIDVDTENKNGGENAQDDEEELDLNAIVDGLGAKDDENKVD